MLPPSVLVVEDESLVRMSIVIELEEAGFVVLEAANADQAQRLLNHEDVGALFTDVDMPGSINGLQLAMLTRERFPGLPIVVTSGQVSLAKAQLPTGAVFLNKPYQTDDVLAALTNPRSS